MGSGHILVYAFDLLIDIYKALGYPEADAAGLIVEKNLYGLDIDERATQLAYFAVMMKGRQYDRRFLTKGVKPNLFAVHDSSRIDSNIAEYFTNGDAKLERDIATLLFELRDAGEIGSALRLTPLDYAALYARFDAVRREIGIHQSEVLNLLLPLVRVSQLLTQKYDVVVTNPPYMGSSGMSPKLSEYVQKHYPDSKSDLFAVFIEVCGWMTAKRGYQAMITQHAWMFLSSFEKLRVKLIHTKEIVNMAHLGARAFDEIGGEVVQTTTWVMRKK